MSQAHGVGSEVVSIAGARVLEVADHGTASTKRRQEADDHLSHRVRAGVLELVQGRAAIPKQHATLSQVRCERRFDKSRRSVGAELVNSGLFRIPRLELLQHHVTRSGMHTPYR